MSSGPSRAFDIRLGDGDVVGLIVRGHCLGWRSRRMTEGDD